MKAIILIIGVVVVVFSLVYLFAYGIPNLQRANEEVRVAQEEYDQSMADLEVSFRDCVDQYDWSACMLTCMESATEEICTTTLQNVRGSM